MKKQQSWAVIVLFVIFIFGFAVLTIFYPDRSYSEAENRTLSQMPSLRVKTLTDGSFESDYEEYLDDQFPFRDAWIGLKTDVERSAFVTETKDIYFAKDQYLIEAHTGTFTSDQAAANIDLLSEFAGNYLAQFGADHLSVMVVPNAVDILRDKLPAFASPYDEGDYLSDIAAALPEGVWFDARPVLQEHADEEIYYRTDHHWKTLGAFYVYQAWAKEQGYQVPEAADYEVETVTDSFEGTIQAKLGIHTVTDSIELYLDPLDPSYTVEKDHDGELTDSLYDYEALETKSKYDIFFGGNNALTQIRTEAGTGRKLLVIKDSYAHCFVPFLLEEFDGIDALDIRYYNQTLSELIEEENYTDILFLYNASGFAEDSSLSKLLF